MASASSMSEVGPEQRLRFWLGLVLKVRRANAAAAIAIALSARFPQLRSTTARLMSVASRQAGASWTDRRVTSLASSA
ncbi:MAG: hypothetical protein ABIT38_22995 [Gemmatimonadaceae bacterium]